VPGIIRIKKYMRVQWAGDVAGIEECIQNVDGEVSWETENWVAG
jgi:hypothetical protein